jgi:hypothetical protein
MAMHSTRAHVRALILIQLKESNTWRSGFLIWRLLPPDRDIAEIWGSDKILIGTSA